MKTRSQNPALAAPILALGLGLAACAPGGVTVNDGDGPDGPNPMGPDAGLPVSGRIVDGLQALYTFEEGVGATVYDHSGVEPGLDLTIQTPNAVSWTSGGLEITSPTALLMASPTRLETACKNAGALTVEAWIRPASTAQSGPAQIISLGQSSAAANFYLAQDESELVGYIRTTAELDVGPQMINSGAGAVTGLTAHVVYTHSGLTDQSIVYVNGAVAATATLAGGFTNWESGFQLAVGNEPLGNRPWRGELFLAAIYCRDLGSTEVRRNYDEGYEGL